MLRITQRMRNAGHKNWHHFDRGGCGECGFYCRECDKVAMCKCWSKEKEEEIESS